MKTIQKFNLAVYFIVLSGMWMMFSGCPRCKDGVGENCPNPINQEELITTVMLSLRDSATNEITVYSFKDLDGEGGNNPVIDSIYVKNGHKYYSDLILLNEQESPADTISVEVKEEADEHFVGYEFSPFPVSLSYLDKDANNLNLGLKTLWRIPGTPTTGTVTVILKHQPDGVKNGTVTPGDTDVEATFPVVIE
ncbi:MAG: type 1 periplasmic binding fold superfamily protein [Bacteroidia bacterium]|nr:type 1 periplasmic binding fold superfamily protein [Bacteroidia bacterium]